MLRALGIFILTSLDGATKRTHEALRGPGTWDAFMRGARLLKEEGVEFAPVFAVSHSNAREAGDFVRLAERIGASSAALIPVMPFGRAGRGGPRADAASCAEAVRLAEAAADEMGFPVSLWCMPFAGLLVKSRYVSWSYCRMSNGMDISPSGDVLLCDVLDIAVSEVRTKGLSEAWRDILSSPVVREVEAGDPCPGCPVGDLCRGGCYARSYAARGAFSGPDPLCPRPSVEGA
jgi:radical SAM protein with 4Fe4S-binding SPASM domain